MTKKQLNINKATTVRTTSVLRQSVSINDIAKLAYIKSITSGKSTDENWLDAEKELIDLKQIK